MERYTEYDEYGNADIIGVFNFEGGLNTKSCFDK